MNINMNYLIWLWTIIFDIIDRFISFGTIVQYDCGCKSLGKTALIWSIEYNREDISRMLIKAGANTDVQDAQGIYLINNKQLYVIL